MAHGKKNTIFHGKIHHFSWENPLFLWPFSIAMLVHQSVNIHKGHLIDLTKDNLHLNKTICQIYINI